MRLSSSVLIFTAVICFADSAVMFEFPDGRTVAMISSQDISMAAESVLITPSGGLFGYSGDSGWIPNMSVRCIFELVNNSQEEQFITVGFPLEAKYGDAYTAMDDEMLFEELSRSYEDENRPSWAEETVIDGLDALEDIPEEMDFRTFINGVETEVYYRKCALSLEEDLLWQPVVAVWKMHFQPGETIILENTYNTAWDYFGGGPWSSFSIDYILTSGGTWSGPIGDAVVILEIPEELPAPVLTDTLLALWKWEGTPVIDHRTVVWHYTDFEPDENISFTVERNIQLGYWETQISAESMYNSLSWTEEDLLYQAYEFLGDEGGFWGMSPDTELILRILEALPWLMNGAEPPNGLDRYLFPISNEDPDFTLTEEMGERLATVHALQIQLRNDIDSAESAGYLEFLPMFVSLYLWDEDVLDMYAAMPEKESRYLDLLEYLETASKGKEIENQHIRSFYNLTGWYHRGYPTGISPIPADVVIGYREMVQSSNR